MYNPQRKYREGVVFKVTCSIVVIRLKFFRTELMAEICSGSLVRDIGKVLPVKFS